MIEIAPSVPIPFPGEKITTSMIDGHGATHVASLLIEFLLAAGGPQVRFAAVANHIADGFASLPSVAVEVRKFGQEIASLDPFVFARFQDVAWTDCVDAEVSNDR